MSSSAAPQSHNQVLRPARRSLARAADIVKVEEINEDEVLVLPAKESVPQSNAASTLQVAHNAQLADPALPPGTVASAQGTQNVVSTEARNTGAVLCSAPAAVVASTQPPALPPVEAEDENSSSEESESGAVNPSQRCEQFDSSSESAS